MGMALAILDTIRIRTKQTRDLNKAENHAKTQKDPKLKKLIPKDLERKFGDESWLNKFRIKQKFTKELRMWSQTEEVRQKIQQGDVGYFEQQYR